jgi:hypothetical protein
LLFAFLTLKTDLFQFLRNLDFYQGNFSGTHIAKTKPEGMRVGGLAARYNGKNRDTTRLGTLTNSAFHASLNLQVMEFMAKSYQFREIINSETGGACVKSSGNKGRDIEARTSKFTAGTKFLDELRLWKIATQIETFGLDHSNQK